MRALDPIAARVIGSLRMKLRGFAELVFAESARLAMVRALERAHADCDQEHPEAWVFEDRRLVFSLDLEVDRASFEAHRRLLDALMDEASGGDASLEFGPLDDAVGERWARRATGSGTHPTGASAEDSDQAGALPTIRTEAS